MSRTSSSLEPEATEGKRRRANPEEEAQRKQQKCDMRKQAASLSRTHKPPIAEATTNHENDNEPRRTASITKMKPTRESDGAPTPTPKDEAQRKQQKCDIRKQKQQARLVHTHDQELQANQRQAAPSTKSRS